MARAIAFHKSFDNDLVEAADWYDDQSQGLGDRFLARAKQAISEVKQDPRRFARFDREGRYARVERFPYVVLFESDEERLFFAGVMHTARDPAKWRSRFK